jgi:hypothetical protein
MRKRATLMLLTTLIALLSPIAAEDPSSDLEAVLVQSNSLDGIWKISAPVYTGGLSVLHGFRGPLRKMQNILCRINGRTVRCIGPSQMVEGNISLNGTHAHFAWGTFLARPVIEATFVSTTQFSGVFSFKLSGVEYSAPDAASGTRLNLAAIPASDDKEKQLLAQLLRRTDAVQPPESFDVQSRDVQLPTQSELGSLGAVQSVIYVGESGEFVGRQDPQAPNSAKYRIPTDYRVYDVEFADGERLCGLRTRSDGKIDGFKCV